MPGCTRLCRVEDAVERVQEQLTEERLQITAEELGLFAWPANPAGLSLILSETAVNITELIRGSALPQGGVARRHKRNPATTDRDLAP